MKNILFILVATLGLTACDTYTVKNALHRNVTINDVLIKSGFCHEFVDFLTVVGDFPLKFSDEGYSEVNTKEYKSENYNVLEYYNPYRLVLEKTDEPCEVKVKSESEVSAKSESEVSAKSESEVSAKSERQLTPVPSSVAPSSATIQPQH